MNVEFWFFYHHTGTSKVKENKTKKTMGEGKVSLCGLLLFES
jgi:hypothetical protein